MDAVDGMEHRSYLGCAARRMALNRATLVIVLALASSGCCMITQTTRVVDNIGKTYVVAEPQAAAVASDGAVYVRLSVQRMRDEVGCRNQEPYVYHFTPTGDAPQSLYLPLPGKSPPIVRADVAAAFDRGRPTLLSETQARERPGGTAVTLADGPPLAPDAPPTVPPPAPSGTAALPSTAPSPTASPPAPLIVGTERSCANYMAMPLQIGAMLIDSGLSVAAAVACIIAAPITLTYQACGGSCPGD